MRILKAILHLAIAALLVSGAAICAAAQSGNAAKQNSRAQTPAAQEKSKTDAQEQTPAKDAAKQNAREGVTLPAAMTLAATESSVRYSYEFTQPNFLFRRIFIYHDENGRGEISFERKDTDAAITDPLELSPAARTRILALWDALRFMDSQASYQSDRQYPHMGTMRIGMTRAGHTRVAEFNWTNDANASALVNEYRRAADQAIFVFNITLARENQPLESPKLMDELEKLYKRNGLSDPKQLVPLLTELSNDERLPLIARNHASRLIKQIQK